MDAAAAEAGRDRSDTAGADAVATRSASRSTRAGGAGRRTLAAEIQIEDQLAEHQLAGLVDRTHAVVTETTGIHAELEGRAVGALVQIDQLRHRPVGTCVGFHRQLVDFVRAAPVAYQRQRMPEPR